MIYPYPLFVYPSLRCNYACSYCFTESSPSEPADSFVIRNWSALLDEAQSLRIPEMRLSGGEPLALPNIERLCGEVSSRKLTYTLTSNGQLVGRHLRWLSSCPPETLWISFHHEYVDAGGFAKVVRRACDALPRVGVNFLASDLAECPKLAERVIEVGAKRIKVLHVTPIGRQRDAQQEGESRVRWAPAILQEILAMHPEVEVRFEAPTLGGQARGPASCVLKERPLLSIHADGRVYACCVVVGSSDGVRGDLQIESLREIIKRDLEMGDDLPCNGLIPGIGRGESSCPLRLVHSGRASGSVDRADRDSLR